jgi:hypothetical protein
MWFGSSRVMENELWSCVIISWSIITCTVSFDEFPKDMWGLVFGVIRFCWFYLEINFAWHWVVLEIWMCMSEILCMSRRPSLVFDVVIPLACWVALLLAMIDSTISRAASIIRDAGGQSNNLWMLKPNPGFPFDTGNVQDWVHTSGLADSMYRGTNVTVLGKTLCSTAVGLPKFASRPLYDEKIHLISSWLSFRLIFYSRD